MNDDNQTNFDLTVFAISANAEALDVSANKAKVGEHELTQLANAATRIQAFILKHRRKAAA